MQGLDMGAIETLICWEQLDINRIQIRNPHTSAEQSLYLTPEQTKQDKWYRDAESGVELEVVESEPFVEWIVVNHNTFGCKLEFITDRSQEGNQFCKGFGGIGGILRYAVQFEVFEEPGMGDDQDGD